jgi:DNA-binding GntR family transcriptional regulator
LQTQLLIGLTSPTHQAHPEEPREYHQAILNAIRAKELARAESLLTLHIVDAQQRAADAIAMLRAGDLSDEQS